jgi:hypothetical protein
MKNNRPYIIFDTDYGICGACGRLDNNTPDLNLYSDKISTFYCDYCNHSAVLCADIKSKKSTTCQQKISLDALKDYIAEYNIVIPESLDNCLSYDDMDIYLVYPIHIENLIPYDKISLISKCDDMKKIMETHPEYNEDCYNLMDTTNDSTHDGVSLCIAGTCVHCCIKQYGTIGGD